MFSLIYAWANNGANNGDAGDLRRHRAHDSVIVMIIAHSPFTGLLWFTLSNVERPPGGHCWNTYLRWVEALRFICGSGTRIFHLRMSGPQMGLGVSPIIRMPQWWSRQWPPWDAPPIVRKLHYVLSHCVCMLFLFGWPPCQRSDVTLMEVSQHALDSLYIRSIWLLYIVMFFVNLIWYLYLFWLNKHCLSLSLSLVSTYKNAQKASCLI